jgi:hypothetical protein
MREIDIFTYSSEMIIRDIEIKTELDWYGTLE